ncbi:hypothetical protein BDV27DRAFT_120275 [Aspergillus caelatus]|uniref:Uncharacterized protein n=1 Tax=Aspergillus caelatus TaxID=61420 RepID=A0A5N7AIY7_9EURO|nr:uncharacterized protein BDV27DRAFT_120275 [Aspergillus caelatus]KAE8369854.1 hypothetical protein BDV27DRAFT_120275 [Aspergillus caelatus]
MHKLSTQALPADESSEAIWGSPRCFAFPTLMEAVWGPYHMPITLRPAEFEVRTSNTAATR